ncbi:nucleotidyltransferase domain-containing protein [uncultured Shewanella sp.]|uniref:nucleotidyltransferase family protein n=1 Tax=uncultured Shewanella sp. TaxID=173975 RepID=UPI0026214CA1|nr:nucleotidyltransferase domain-containing protein [uncultured Shewanella sp.]
MSLVSAVQLGLTENELKMLLREIELFPVFTQVVLFGSRAKGTYKPGSDVDLAVMGDKVSSRDVSALNYALNEETCLPYYFDIVHMTQASPEPLRRHIKEHGILLASKVAS